MSKRHYIIPVFVSHRGCPHDCIFCNQKKITGHGGDASPEDVRDKIEQYLQTIPQQDTCVELAFYGGSFTAIPIEQQRALLHVVQPYIDQGQIESIRISTRPDCITEEIMQLLMHYRVKIIELGVQSMDEDVLTISNRGHRQDDVVHSVQMLKSKGFTVGVQVMVGLPGDTEEKCIATVKKLAALKPDIARIYPALVITHTYMEQMYYRGEYQPLTLQQAVNISKKLLTIFETSNVEVIRIGLQPTENILEGKEVVAGPFHPSMRQLVMSALYQDMMMHMLKEDGEIKHLEIYVHPLDISDVLGQKRSNIQYLKEQLNIEKVVVLQDMESPRQSVMLKCGEITRSMSIKDFQKILEI